jgi:metal-sulfur cluster biosynthetic enzyme
VDIEVEQAMSDENQNPAGASEPPMPSEESDSLLPNEADEAQPSAGALSTDQVKLALRKVKDPELGLNIVDLGLIYDIAISDGNIHVDMTLTSPGCPAGPQIMTDVERVLQALPGVGEVELNLVWSPYWTPERIEPRVRAYMGL